MGLKSMVAGFAKRVESFVDGYNRRKERTNLGGNDHNIYGFLVYKVFTYMLFAIFIFGSAVVGIIIMNKYFPYSNMWFSETGIDFGIFNSACNLIAHILLSVLGFLIGMFGGTILCSFLLSIAVVFTNIYSRNRKIREWIDDAMSE